MTSNLLLSTEVSTTVQTIQASNDKMDISYAPKEPIPEMFRTQIKVQPMTTPADIVNNYLAYQIPKTGALRNSVLSLEMTATGATGSVFAADWSGLDLIDRIEFRTSSLLLQTFHGVSIKARVENMPLNQKLSILKGAAPRTTSTNAVAIPALAATAFYVNLPIFNFLTEHSNLLETLRCWLPKTEQLYVYVYFNSLTRCRVIAASNTTNLVPTSAYLYMNYLTLAQQTQNELVAKNASSSSVSKNLLLSYDYQRFTKTCTSTTANDITFNITQAVRRMWITLNPLNDSGTYAVAGDILTVGIDLNGTPLFSGEKKSVINYASEQMDNCNVSLTPASTTIVYDDKNAVCLNFCLYPEQYNLFSGVCSFAQIPNVKASITHGSLTTAANYEIVVVCETVTWISIGDNGILSISAMT